MASNLSNIKKTGRPRVDATPVTVRIPPDLLARLDAWIAAQPNPVSRPEAIRAIVAAGLHILATEAAD
jgi:hypothetical protein